MKKLKVCMLITCLIMCFSSITLAANFYDIKGTEYEGVVDRVARLGIINGVSENAFAPNKSITRAELAKMIVYTRKLEKYADTSGIKAGFKDTKGHWAESYIAVAADMGFLKGYDDGTFKPDKSVSYAEVVAIILRGLGYLNIDESSGSTWYSEYMKKMYELKLNENVPEYTSNDAPAKRGDVTMLWWNMLVSDRWVIQSETEGAGFYYTYSPKPQLEVLFPGFYAIKGRVNYITNGTSGDTITIEINNRLYETTSEVPIYSIGAQAVGVYDSDSKRLYGVSYDDDLDEYELVSGPIFYLEEQGYKLKKAKYDATIGYRDDATYAYVLVSKETGEILRVTYIDASNSLYVTEIEVKEIPDREKTWEEEEGLESELLAVHFNGSEVASTYTSAVVIKNGKKVDWEDVEDGVVLTCLIPDALYTYEDRTINGDITDYSNLRKLGIENDEYIVSDRCIYTVYGDYSDEEGSEEKLKKYYYDGNMKEKKLESLLSRDTVFYFNIAEEITYIYFGKYRPSNIMDKYDNGEYRVFYVTSFGYTTNIPELDDWEMAQTEDDSGDVLTIINGKYMNGNPLKVLDASNGELEYKIGDFIVATDLEKNAAKEIEIVSSNLMYEDDDFSVLYDYDGEFSNQAFGEYVLLEESLVYRVDKYYRENSAGKIEECRITRLSSVEQLGDLSKYKINLLCNNHMEIDVVFAEKELNRTNYPIANVVSIEKIQSPEDEPDDADYIPFVKIKINTVGKGTSVTKALSGDCMVGELVSYESGDESIKIKERFDRKFLGYAKDIVIESFNNENKIATVANAPEKLNLSDTIYVFNGKEVDLLDYKFLFTIVKKDSTTGEWKFTNCKFYEKEELELKAGDRIALGELNGIAIVYRGWEE